MTREGVLCHARLMGLLVQTVAERTLEREENERRETGTDREKDWTRYTWGSWSGKHGNRREEQAGGWGQRVGGMCLGPVTKLLGFLCAVMAALTPTAQKTAVGAIE